MGKGSKRRLEDANKVRENWDAIFRPKKQNLKKSQIRLTQGQVSPTL